MTEKQYEEFVYRLVDCKREKGRVEGTVAGIQVLKDIVKTLGYEDLVELFEDIW